MSDLSEKLGVASYRWADGSSVIRLVGSLDGAGASGLMDETTQLDSHDGDRVVLHMEDVTFLDTAGIGGLFYAEAFVRTRGGDLVIGSPSPRVRAILELAELDRHFRPDDDLLPPAWKQV